jgi:phosphoglycerate kinase
MHKLSIKDYPIQGKRVLMRVDFNVPMNKDGTIADDSRIQASLDSIKYILSQNCSLILMSHLGKPKGKNVEFSLLPCGQRLSKLLGKEVKIAPDCIGPEVEKMAKALKPQEILLLENLRFYEAEEKPEKDPSFAKKLASLGDIYVNDAFGTAHRKHSSTYTIAQYFPNRALAGLLLEKEVTYLSLCLKNPKRPFFAIIGGSKISTKTGVIINLIDKVDELFIGGGMFYTFAKASGITIGNSICEDDQIETAKKIMVKCKEKNVPLNLPLDLKIADNFSNDAKVKVISSMDNFSTPWQGMDIGPKTIASWTKKISAAATIFWNGPLGVFELPNFAEGTKQIAKALSLSSAITIVGGGDSIAAINSLNLASKFTHLSTGGGASLEFIEQGTLPGVEVLTEKKGKLL